MEEDFTEYYDLCDQRREETVAVDHNVRHDVPRGVTGRPQPPRRRRNSAPEEVSENSLVGGWSSYQPPEDQRDLEAEAYGTINGGNLHRLRNGTSNTSSPTGGPRHGVTRLGPTNGFVSRGPASQSPNGRPGTGGNRNPQYFTKPFGQAQETHRSRSAQYSFVRSSDKVPSPSNLGRPAVRAQRQPQMDWKIDDSKPKGPLVHPVLAFNAANKQGKLNEHPVQPGNGSGSSKPDVRVSAETSTHVGRGLAKSKWAPTNGTAAYKSEDKPATADKNPKPTHAPSPVPRGRGSNQYAGGNVADKGHERTLSNLRNGDGAKPEHQLGNGVLQELEQPTNDLDSVWLPRIQKAIVRPDKLIHGVNYCQCCHDSNCPDKEAPGNYQMMYASAKETYERTGRFCDPKVSREVDVAARTNGVTQVNRQVGSMLKQKA